MKITTFCCGLLGLLIPIQALAFNMRTVYEDAEAADPGALIISILGAVLALPFIYIALRRRTGWPSQTSSKYSSKYCAKLALRQLGSFFGIFYIVGGLVLMIIVVLFAFVLNAWCVITDSGPFDLNEQTFDVIRLFVAIYMVSWWIVSVHYTIKWLPREKNQH